jgi:hypothetical protein
VPDAPSEAVELHARDHIDLAAPGGLEERVEGGPACAVAPEIPRSTYSVAVQPRASANSPSGRSWVSGVCPGSPGRGRVETRAYSATRVILTSLGLPSASARC